MKFVISCDYSVCEFQMSFSYSSTYETLYNKLKESLMMGNLVEMDSDITTLKHVCNRLCLQSL